MVKQKKEKKSSCKEMDIKLPVLSTSLFHREAVMKVRKQNLAQLLAV